jgi:hypothetical protein
MEHDPHPQFHIDVVYGAGKWASRSQDDSAHVGKPRSRWPG